VGSRAGLMKDGKLKNGRKALVTDAGGTMFGAALGTSPVTAYIESAAGVGGKTGLVAVTVAALFALSLVLAPLAGAVPPYATAPALIFVAALFATELKEIDWSDITESLPALVTALAIPLTFSIAEGIGMGFIAYAGIKLLTGRTKEIGAGVAIIGIAFIAKVALY
jgi:AGZA family xanthine/uracil permease-like MFS transporter